MFPEVIHCTALLHAPQTNIVLISPDQYVKMETLSAAHIGKDKYRTTLRIRNHELIADEPEANGGKDLGPTAHELLAAALAACTNATLRMYADRKQWPLESVDTLVQIIHGSSFDETRMERTIRLSGSLEEEHRQRLLQIAERCPVHRTLSGQLVIHTHLQA